MLSFQDSVSYTEGIKSHGKVVFHIKYSCIKQTLTQSGIHGQCQICISCLVHY